MLAKVEKLDARNVLLLILEQVVRRLRHEDLPTVPGRRDARGAMDGNARVRAVGRRGLTRVDSDANSDIGAVRPRMLRQRPLSVDGSEHGVARVCECDEERITLGVDLVTVVRCERFAKDPLVLGQHRLIAVAQPLDELGRPLDIGEEKGDRAAGNLRHALSVTWPTATGA